MSSLNPPVYSLRNRRPYTINLKFVNGILGPMVGAKGDDISFTGMCGQVTGF